PSVMAMMTERRTRHVLVMDGGTPVGVVSIGDVVKHRLDELQSNEQVLYDYIAGTGYH
ncbi:MAG: CBS domain-containing protein, partial [Mesorhizobium sp.]